MTTAPAPGGRAEMRSRWDDAEAAAYPGELGSLVYASRLIGRDPTLVLHGGGNTSIKLPGATVTGDPIDLLVVKASGYDLATIGIDGFAPLRLGPVLRLLELDGLADAEMMNQLRTARVDSRSADPSVETILHALIPDRVVLHSHADAVLNVTNLIDGEQRVGEILGDEVVAVPYCMPGFDLARLCATEFPRRATAATMGMVLHRHGLFTFGGTAHQAYERHIALISRIEEWLDQHGPRPAGRAPLGAVDPIVLADLRRQISAAAGAPMIVTRTSDGVAATFVGHPDLPRLAAGGPLTPDHVIRTKAHPLVGRDVAAFVAGYTGYFEAHRRPGLQMVDPAPRVLLDPQLGLLTSGRGAKDAAVAADIFEHTMDVLLRAEALGGAVPLGDDDLFAMEYWELEQAKLRLAGPSAPFAGQVALVTGAASGIGRACARALMGAGAAVVAVDRSEAVEAVAEGPDWTGVVADVTDAERIARAVALAAARYGGVDIVVAAAGVFPPSLPIAALPLAEWRSTMAVNAESLLALFAATHPLLARSPVGGRVVLIGSRNVPAPGPGAAAYSASKAAAVQLARVAALEWAGDGITVNIVHPDAVFDTGLWTPELIAERAARYGLSVDDYKRRNLLKTEVQSETVAAAVVDLCSPAFQSTTGAQIPIDGGNDRVI